MQDWIYILTFGESLVLYGQGRKRKLVNSKTGQVVKKYLAKQEVANEMSTIK